MGLVRKGRSSCWHGPTPWSMRTGWTEVKANQSGRAGKTVRASGGRASARGEKRGDLIGRGSIKPSYDLMEEQIIGTMLQPFFQQVGDPRGTQSFRVPHLRDRLPMSRLAASPTAKPRVVPTRTDERSGRLY